MARLQEAFQYLRNARGRDCRGTRSRHRGLRYLLPDGIPSAAESSRCSFCGWKMDRAVGKTYANAREHPRGIRPARGILCGLITIHLAGWSISWVRRPVSGGCHYCQLQLHQVSRPRATNCNPCKHDLGMLSS